jgi:ABC-type dipeptide/oligopeptide/nickel transport system permease subunit
VWWEFTAATIAIIILSLALNTLGDALRDALDPKLHGVK